MVIIIINGTTGLNNREAIIIKELLFYANYGRYLNLFIILRELPQIIIIL